MAILHHACTWPVRRDDDKQFVDERLDAKR
jgi:hypothetical protein